MEEFLVEPVELLPYQVKYLAEKVAIEVHTVQALQLTPV